ncbi:MAG: methionine synthase [Muribaculaceae bacterium]|nr:methionine synthase [Muribaculaceae bacterium]
MNKSAIFDILCNRLSERIMVLDGAMGTMIMKASPTEEDFRGEAFLSHPVALKGCNDILTISFPELISGIHKEYLEAGADIICTDTFNANRLSLAEYRLESQVKEICKAGANIAKAAVEEFCNRNDIPASERPLVAGSMGPTGVSLSISIQESPSPSDEFDKMADAYREQAEALIEGGVDILLLETVFDTMNAKAAAYGIEKAFHKLQKRIPVMISATLTENGRLLSGQTISMFVDALSHLFPVSFGLNCGFGAKALQPFISELASLPGVADKFISLHPNAGLPDAMGCYLDSPQKMEEELTPLLKNGIINIIGGCCGTTPDHIRRIARLAKKCKPRELKDIPVSDSGFIKVGERCNVAGSRKFLRLVKEKNWKECVGIAAAQIEKGASILDINVDDSLLDAHSAMAELITRLSSDRLTSSIPLMIDSSDFSVISEALRMLPLKGIVNSISLKNGEKEFLDHAREINDLGCAMVVMAFDEKGQADTLERRKEICSRAYNLLVENVGINPTNIIFDPNVLAVATGIPEHDFYAHDFIRTTEWIKNNLPGAKVSGGISNLSFSFRGIDPVRKAMHSVFLEANISKGMDMAIINPATPLTSEWIDPDLLPLVRDVIYADKADASSKLLEYAMKVKKELDEKKAARLNEKSNNQPSSKIREALPQSASEALAHALIEGDSSSLNDLIEGALNECEGKAMLVVEKSLMKGMDKVGELFGNGDLFLPQVVRAASVMKNAVDILTPLIESQQNSGSGISSQRPVVILATVKGDVHDIGKNIVGVVLRCSGFEVEDLGVMVEPDIIIERAVSLNAAAIGLSGLITPSLHEMAIVAEKMEEKKLDIPLFIGGATTSALHTAVKIAPHYSGPVVHTKDAASLPPAVKAFTNGDQEYRLHQVKDLKSQQQKMREEFQADNLKLSLKEADAKRDKVQSPAPKPLNKGKFDISIPIEDLISLINWKAFLAEWKLNPKESELSNDTIENVSKESERILSDAKALLESLSGLTAKARVIVTGASASDNDILLEDGLVIPTIRSLIPNPVSGKTLAMSDFIYDNEDHVALFAVTMAHSGIYDEIGKMKHEDEYRALLLQSLSHRLVEAATEWTHRYLSTNIWGLVKKEGIRPAIGYSSLPDQSLVFILDKLIDYASMGIEITEHGALSPSATTTGLVIMHPDAHYFEVGQLSQESIEEYASRRGFTPVEMKRFL